MKTTFHLARVRILAAAAIVAAAPLALHSQTATSITDRVNAAPNGKVRFTFAARPDVCGSGNSIHTGNSTTNDGHGGSSADVVWDDDCGHGPVRIVLTVANHAVTGLHTYVGGRWRAASGVTDLGDIAPQTASDYLLSLATRSPEAVGRQAIFPSTLADGVTVWPSLLRIARESAIPSRTRKDAVFWLGQMAGDKVTSSLAQLATEDTVDRDIRKSAVFALSQRPHDEGVPALIHVARTNRDPAVRKQALFWLGQSDDPRALALFETILSGSGKY